MSPLVIDRNASLPDSWALVPLDEIAALNPKPNISQLRDDQAVHFVPMAAAAENFEGLDISTKRRLSEVRKGYTAFRSGEVLLAKITPCMENGKGGLVPELPLGIAFGSTEFHVLRPEAGVSGAWLAHFLSQREFRRIARQNMTGTAGQLRVPSKWLSSVNIPIAPPGEQVRIVAKLDELLSDLDAGVAELKAAQQKLQRYRQSLLKAAVEGALTAEWRQKNQVTETGAELLQRILRERRARWEEQQLAKFAAQDKTPPKGWKDKYPEPQPPKTEGLPELPEGWVWASVEQATAEALIGLDRGAEHQSKGGSGTLYLKMNNITLDGKILLDDLVRVDASASEIERFAALPGDILFNTRNSKELVGKAGLVQPHTEALIFNNNLMRLRFVDAVTPSFGISTLCSPAFRVRMEGIKKATTSVAAVYARDLWPLAIAIPPPTEQRLICSLLEDQLQAIDQQEALIRRMTRGLDAQRQSILRAAFRGELVPQDPNDEPASVLLARLRAERSGTKPAKTERKARKAKGAA